MQALAINQRTIAPRAHDRQHLVPADRASLAGVAGFVAALLLALALFPAFATAGSTASTAGPAPLPAPAPSSVARD